MYNPGIIVGAIIVILCCPDYLYDSKHTEEYKLKQNETKLESQLHQKKLETAIKQQDLNIEKQQITLSRHNDIAESEIEPYCSDCIIDNKNLSLKKFRARTTR